MSQLVKLEHEYQQNARQVWHVATNIQYFEKIMRGLVSFRGLPKAPLHEGQVLQLQVSLFGILPYQPYHINIVTFDEDKMQFCSMEKGVGVHLWRHELRVMPNGDDSGCKIIEQIEIDAGVSTPIFVLWAQFLYKKRHPRRLSLLAELASKSL